MARYTPKMDEWMLLVSMQNIRFAENTVRWHVTELGMDHKRAAYILGKWCVRGWYDYGVSVDLGWLTQEGKEAKF